MSILWDIICLRDPGAHLLLNRILLPRWIQTDLGNSRAAAVGLKEAPVTLTESVKGVLDEVSRQARLPRIRLTRLLRLTMQWQVIVNFAPLIIRIFHGSKMKPRGWINNSSYKDSFKFHTA